jgi:hypothetical protein
MLAWPRRLAAGVSAAIAPDPFLAAFEVVVGHEGGFGANPQDRGSWTGAKSALASWLALNTVSRPPAIRTWTSAT